MQVIPNKLSWPSLRSMLCCGLLTFPCLAYTQSYYGAGYQPSNVKPFGGNISGGQGHAKYLQPTRDLYNQYFYHNRSVSPYLNLGRPLTGGSTAYHAYVRPEQQRRERQSMQQSTYVDARKQQVGYAGMSYGASGKLGAGGGAKPRPNAYYRQWYGR